MTATAVGSMTDEDRVQEFEIECPACHETFVVDEDTVLDGSMECPACGETLEFEVSCEDDEDEDEDADQD